MAKVILFDGKVVTYTSVDGETRPLIYEASIPPQTIRFRFEETDYNPTVIENGGVWTKVSDSLFNDWDWYCEDTFWVSKFDGSFIEEVSIIATGDMTNVTSVESMFRGCIGLTSIPENSFNNVTDTYGMFDGCTSLTKIPDNSFNNVLAAPAMFCNCPELTNIPENSFNNVTDAREMFYGCTGLTSIPNNMFNNVKNASFMFEDCISLTNIPENSFNNVTEAGEMFRHCVCLTSIPNDMFNNVTNASYMFEDCTSLTNIPENSFYNVTDTYGMFDGCTRVEHGALALYNKWIAGGKEEISHTDTFKDCGKDTETGLAELQQIPQSWGGLADDTTDKLIIGGKEYRTVTIGNQTWMAQNLDLETDSGSVVSERRSENEDYGRLYQWDKAVEVANSIEGWHLPTREEWNTLRDFVGGENGAGTKLKAKSGWESGMYYDGNGTDDFGFGALPAGTYDSNYLYQYIGSRVFFWTSSVSYGSWAYVKGFDTGAFMDDGDSRKTSYYSVRLIKDN